MADIPLIVNPGGLFTRFGKLAFAINSHNLYRGDGLGSSGELNSIGPNINAFVNQYNSSGQPIRDNVYSQVRDAGRASMSAYVQGLATYARNTLIEMANLSVPLNQLSVSAAMAVLLAQMADDTESVKANTTSVSVATDAGNTGNSILVASRINAAGLPMEYILPEDITVVAQTDSQSGTATQGRESFRVTSPVAQTDQLMWDWPKGSGIGGSLGSSASDGSNQKLVNGGFETWSGTPLAADNWTAVTGTYATNLVRAAVPHLGTYSLSMVGDGSSNWAVKQAFNDGTLGTSYRLKPSTVYGFNAFVKMSATPAAGVFGASLVNSSNTVMTNDAGTSQTISVTLTGVSTSWVAVSGYFQTPSILPTGNLYLLLKLTTALSNSRTLYIDDVTLIEGVAAYQGGSYLSIYPGDTATVKGDNFTVTVANDWWHPLNAPNGPKFQRFLQQVFDCRSLGVQFPSSASPTISDNLINGQF